MWDVLFFLGARVQKCIALVFGQTALPDVNIYIYSWTVM
jgi:hypothetical protein